ncbi:hypothetical protein MO973_08915 [Paenibacillus sp. TRM 82003]|nr:hypothetical protein [Paenibacillus sp. TRM 82003]
MKDHDFEKAYAVWFERHLNESTGERRAKLEKRLRNERESGEDSPEKMMLRKLWWPLFGILENLHPEYEVKDFEGKDRFLDLAYIQYPLLIDLEGDGYGPHLKNISRYQFADERRRDSALIILGWEVIRFSYDDIRERPLECQQLLKHRIAKLL